jgi:hypothetical protein
MGPHWGTYLQHNHRGHSNLDFLYNFYENNHTKTITTTTADGIAPYFAT